MGTQVPGWSWVLAALLGGCAAGAPDSGTDDDAPAGSAEAAGFSFGEEQACDSPVDGFARLADEAEARGLAFDPPEDMPFGMRPCVAGSGVVAEDLDGDGDIDVLTGAADPPRIFENDGRGNFSEQVESPPWPGDGRWVDSFGVLDLDGDRLPELLYLGYGFAWIASNLGDLRWGDPAAVWEAEAAPELPMFLTATWGDVDGDGDLDILLPTVRMGLGETNGQDLPGPGVHRLLRNDGGAWTEIAQLTPHGEPNYVQVATFTDRDGDGDQDLLLPSEHGMWSEPTAFFRNDGLDGDGLPVLVNDAEELGADIRPGAMGVDAVDLNGDGDLDYCVSNIGSLMCLQSSGDGGYAEAAVALGLVPPAGVDPYDWSTWSLDFVDVQNDGWEDLAVAAGPVFPAPGAAQPDALFERVADGGFVNRSEDLQFDDSRSHCGLAAADFAGDGYLDVLVTGNEGPPRLWMNPCGEAAWIAFELDGPASNRLAVGGRVTVEAGGRRWIREVFGMRAVGQSPSRLHFGLGEVDVVDRVEVRWPDGATSLAEGVPLRRLVTVVHPDAIP